MKKCLLKPANRKKIFVFTVLLICISAHVKSTGKYNEESIKRIGAKYTEWFYASELDSLINQILDPNYKLSELIQFRKKVEIQLGSELEILNERAQDANDKMAEMFGTLGIG